MIGPDIQLVLERSGSLFPVAGEVQAGETSVDSPRRLIISFRGLDGTSKSLESPGTTSDTQLSFELSRPGLVDPTKSGGFGDRAAVDGLFLVVRQSKIGPSADEMVSIDMVDRHSLGDLGTQDFANYPLVEFDALAAMVSVGDDLPIRLPILAPEVLGGFGIEIFIDQGEPSTTKFEPTGSGNGRRFWASSVLGIGAELAAEPAMLGDEILAVWIFASVHFSLLIQHTRLDH